MIYAAILIYFCGASYYLGRVTENGVNSYLGWFGVMANVIASLMYPYFIIRGAVNAAKGVKNERV